jgi:flagellar FliL protein
MASSDATMDELDEVLEGDITEGLEKKKITGKKLVIFGGALLLLLALVGAGLWYFGIFGGHEDEAAKQAETSQTKQDKPANVVFYDLPEILVTLNSGGRKTNYLKLKVALELNSTPGATDRLEALLPRIIDNFQVYLRELRVEDLDGSAGLVRLKEELLVRVNAAVRPVRVNDVLFKEMLVQ